MKFALLLAFIPLISSTTTYVAETPQGAVLTTSDRLEVIAWCESDNQHFQNGKVIQGEIDSDDIGKFQINRRVWGETAEKLGLNLFDEKDNYRMALWIAENDYRGLENWDASYDYENNKCWRDARQK